MQLDDLIFILTEIRSRVGNVKVYKWSDYVLHHVDVNNVRLVDESEFNESIDDSDYIEDFNRIKNNVVID